MSAFIEPIENNISNNGKLIKIVHISDLHFGSQYFVEEWSNNVIDIISKVEPDIMIITGDITASGCMYEYEMVKDFIDKIEVEDKIIIPGNHDARNGGDKIFEKVIGERFPFYENDNFAIIGLDSSEPDIDDGHIGRENYKMLKEKLGMKKKMKILALHHHLISVPGTGREMNILVDAGEVLNICMEMGVNFVFSGHKHLPWIWSFENMYLITAGTATTRRLKGLSYPSFNIVNIDGEDITIKEINVLKKTPGKIERVAEIFNNRLSKNK